LTTYNNNVIIILKIRERELGKMRTKIEYIVHKIDFDYATRTYNTVIDYREASFTITAKTEEEVNRIHESLSNELEECGFNLVGDTWAEKEKNSYVIYDSIIVNDKEEYEEIKTIYKEWKRSIKNIKVEEIKMEESTEENTITENSTEVTETKIEISEINADILDKTVKIESGNRTYTGKVYDINPNNSVIWIETNEDMFGIEIANIQNLYEVTERNKLNS
jgi:hypothetical protein